MCIALNQAIPYQNIKFHRAANENFNDENKHEYARRLRNNACLFERFPETFRVDFPRPFGSEICPNICPSKSEPLTPNIINRMQAWVYKTMLSIH